MKLLSKILASLEEVKQTQKLHSAMITSLQKQQNVASGITLQLPAGLTLPFHSFADVDNAEELLKDDTVQKILVLFLLSSCSIFYICKSRRYLIMKHSTVLNTYNQSETLFLSFNNMWLSFRQEF